MNIKFLIIWIIFFLTGCLLLHNWIIRETAKNIRCGHMKTITVTKIGYAFDGYVGDVGCFGEWNNGKLMTTFWNVGDCLDKTPIEIEYPDYECF